MPCSAVVKKKKKKKLSIRLSLTQPMEEPQQPTPLQPTSATPPTVPHTPPTLPMGYVSPAFPSPMLTPSLSPSLSPYLTAGPPPGMDATQYQFYLQQLQAQMHNYAYMQVCGNWRACGVDEGTVLPHRATFVASDDVVSLFFVQCPDGVCAACRRLPRGPTHSNKCKC